MSGDGYPVSFRGNDGLAQGMPWNRGGVENYSVPNKHVSPMTADAAARDPVSQQAGHSATTAQVCAPFYGTACAVGVHERQSQARSHAQHVFQQGPLHALHSQALARGQIVQPGSLSTGGGQLAAQLDNDRYAQAMPVRAASEVQRGAGHYQRGQMHPLHDCTEQARPTQVGPWASDKVEALHGALQHGESSHVGAQQPSSHILHPSLQGSVGAQDRQMPALLGTPRRAMVITGNDSAVPHVEFSSGHRMPTVEYREQLLRTYLGQGASREEAHSLAWHTINRLHRDPRTLIDAVILGTNAKALHYRRAAKCVSDDYVGELLRPEPDASGAGGVGFLSPADLFSPVPSKSAEILHSEEAEAAQELLQMKLLRMFGADEAPKWKAAQGLVKCGGENGRWSDWSALAEWRSKRRGVRRHAGGSLGSIGRDWYGRGGKTQALVSNEASGGGDRAVHCGSSLSAERERVRFVLPSAVDVGGNSKDNVVAMCRMEEDPDAFEQKLDVENEML